jgi:STE24 endopeptidase
VGRHRGAVPERFADTITLAAHQKAADYTIARTRLSMLEVLAGAAVLIGFTLLGGLRAEPALAAFGGGGYFYGVALIASVVLIGGLIDLPFSLYGQFVHRAAFRLQQDDVRAVAGRLLKMALLACVLGLPLLLLAVLWLMDQAGSLWWLWTWLVWVAFSCCCR